MNSKKEPTFSLPVTDQKKFLQFGKTLVEKARALIVPLWESGSFMVETKADLTPVSEVDYKTEELIREVIQKHFPTHGIIGEEFEPVNKDSEFQWTIDPIDGTQSLVNQIPTFGTLLGLRFQNEAVLGFIDHPVLDICSYGGKGVGVYYNEKPLSYPVSWNATNPHQIIATGVLATFQRSNNEEVFFKLHKQFPHARIYYDCYAQTLTLTGALLGTIEYSLKIWDTTPIEALIRGIGGKFSYLGENSDFSSQAKLHIVFGKSEFVDTLLPLLN